MTKRFWILLSIFFLSLPLHSFASQADELPAAGQTFKGRERLDFANGLYARNMFDLALEEYNKLLQEFPGDSFLSDAYFRIAESLFQLSQYEKALAAYELYQKTYPNDPSKDMATLRIAESLYQLDRKDAALEKIKPLLTSKDILLKNAADYYTGRILLEKDDLGSARSHLSRVIELTEKNPFKDIAAYHLGKAELAAGRAAEAIAAFQKAEQTENPDIKIFTQFGLAQASFQLKDYRTAAENFLIVHEKSKDFGLQSSAFINYLTALYEAADYASIMEAFAKKPHLEPESERTALLITARSSYALKKYREAAEFYKKLLSENALSASTSNEAKEGLIDSLIQGGFVQEAADTTLELNIQPDTASERLLYLAEEAFRRSGQSDKALSVIETFLNRYPDSSYKPQMMINRGYILLDSEKPAHAREAFDHFLIAYKNHPFSKQILMNRISLDISLKEWESAIQSSQAFLEVYASEPEASAVFYQLGSIHLTKKDYAEAAKIYESLRAKYPNSEKNQEALFYLAYSLQMQNQFARAAELYQKLEKEKVSVEIYAASLKNLAYCFIHQDKLLDAASIYYKLIAEYPKEVLSDEVYFWLADFYQRNADGEKLLNITSRLKDTSFAKEKPSRTEFLLAEGLRMTRDYANAITHYNTALAFPNAPKAEILLGKGISETARGNLDEGILDLEDAVHEAKDNHKLSLEARLYLADAYTSAERYKEAAKAYFAAAILYDNEEQIPLALMRAGESFEKAGLKEEALKAYEELIARYAKSEVTVKVRARVSTLKKAAAS